MFFWSSYGYGKQQYVFSHFLSLYLLYKILKYDSYLIQRIVEKVPVF